MKLEDMRNQAQKNGDYSLGNTIRGGQFVGRDKLYHYEVAEICEINIRTLRDWLPGIVKRELRVYGEAFLLAD